MPLIYDVAVIGGGPAGYVAAIKAAQLGGKVVVFERSVLGGTCLNRGCIPTKSYVKTAELLHSMTNAGERGVVLDGRLSLDMAKAHAYKARVVKQLTAGVGSLLKSNAIDVVYGEAQMQSEEEIAVDGAVYRAKRTLLCGGSKPMALPIPGADCANVITSDELLELTEVPKRLCIVGGGVIGCEIATAFSLFGSEVTVVEMLPRLASVLDEELSGALCASIKRLGVAVHLDTRVEAIKSANGEAVVITSAGEIACDKILMSAGRTADLACLGVLNGQIEVERGKVKADDFMRTNISNIYAPGDINGRQMLAHAAFKMGEVAAMNAMGANESCGLDYVPSCVYAIPEAASVGLSEALAIERVGQQNVAIGRFPFMANGRALACGEGEGFVKVVCDKRYGELLGVHIFGAAAAELIAEPAALMSAEITVDEIAQIIHAHPTFSEAFMEACADARGLCVHLPRKK